MRLRIRFSFATSSCCFSISFVCSLPLSLSLAPFVIFPVNVTFTPKWKWQNKKRQQTYSTYTLYGISMLYTMLNTRSPRDHVAHKSGKHHKNCCWITCHRGYIRGAWKWKECPRNVYMSNGTKLPFICFVAANVLVCWILLNKTKYTQTHLHRGAVHIKCLQGKIRFSMYSDGERNSIFTEYWTLSLIWSSNDIQSRPFFVYSYINNNRKKCTVRAVLSFRKILCASNFIQKS